MIRVLATGFLLAGVLLPFGGAAHRLTEEGNRHYEGEEYDEALRSYTEAQVADPESSPLFYNIGNVLYRQGDFPGAEEAYSRSLQSARPELSPSSAFNLGNALYRQGVYDEAAEAYRRVLRDAPGDHDAKRNLELALQALRENRQEQQPQQNPDSGEEGEKNDQDDKEAPSEAPPEPGDGEDSPGRQGEEESKDTGEPENRPGRMSEEEAQRLLDSLSDQEKENLRKAARLQRRSAGTEREEDW